MEAAQPLVPSWVPLVEPFQWTEPVEAVQPSVPSFVLYFYFDFEGAEKTLTGPHWPQVERTVGTFGTYTEGRAQPRPLA